MNIDTAFPSKYLKTTDLAGRPVTVTIARVVLERVGDKERPVCYFVGKQKAFALNKTNARAITAIAGTPETEHWGGLAIQLIVTPVEYQGQMVDAIRVRPAGRPEPLSPPAPRPIHPADFTSDDIPF